MFGPVGTVTTGSLRRSVVEFQEVPDDVDDFYDGYDWVHHFIYLAEKRNHCTVHDIISNIEC